MFRARRLWPLALALGVIGAAVLTGSVHAHSRPVRFEPPPGEVLNTAPSQVTGWFESAVRRDPNWSFIHVADAQGNRVDIGDTNLSIDRQQMTASLKPGLGPGRYTVTWRTYDDDDGAIFGDCYNFYVGQQAADAAQSANTRLDNGGACQRIDVEAKQATPVPATPAVLATAAASGSASEFELASTASTSSGGSSGIPIWALVVAVVGSALFGAGAGRLSATWRR